jgi:hypothetical protein
MSENLVDQAKEELEAAQSALEAALRAWDESVSELWRTSLALTFDRQSAGLGLKAPPCGLAFKPRSGRA